MKIDYAMRYESIVLTAWGEQHRYNDPFKLGTAGVFSGSGADLNKPSAHSMKFSLAAALRKVAADNSNEENGISESLLMLEHELWEAKEIDTVCKIMDQTKELFAKVDLVVIY